MSDILNGVPEIQAGLVQVAGQQVQIVWDVDPEQFPNGLDLLMVEPGKLAPFGKITIGKNQMIAVVPPTMASALRGEIKKAIAKAGQIAAPSVAR